MSRRQGGVRESSCDQGQKKQGKSKESPLGGSKSKLISENRGKMALVGGKRSEARFGKRGFRVKRSDGGVCDGLVGVGLGWCVCSGVRVEGEDGGEEKRG